MKKTFKCTISILLSILMIVGVFAIVPFTAGAAESGWHMAFSEELQDGDTVVISMTTGDGSLYGLSNINSSSDSPSAVSLKSMMNTEMTQHKLISSDDAIAECTWTVGINDGVFTFTNASGNEFGCGTYNTSVRVGEPLHTDLTIKDGYLYNAESGRYFGVYTANKDWRCYTSTTGNIAGQYVTFWKLSEDKGTYDTSGGGSGGDTPVGGVWCEVSADDIVSGDTLIFTSTKDGTTAYGMNNGAVAAAPAAVGFTVLTDSETSIKYLSGKDEDFAACTWKAGYNTGTFTFVSGNNHLSCDNKNNGVRIGANTQNNTFSLENGYLKNSGTNRYLGVYINQDWRCYTSTGGNIADQTVQFWKYVEPAAATYTVTWKNGNEVLETDEDVAEGALPSYDGEVPTKDEDESNTYEFAGWSNGETTYGLNDALPEVTADVTYTAVFTAVPKSVEQPETIELTFNADNATDLKFADSSSTDGFWEVSALNEDYYVVVGSEYEVYHFAGTYTWEELFPDLCYMTYITGADGETNVYFTDGSCTITVDGDITTLAGTFTGEDGKIYAVTITNAHAPQLPDAIKDCTYGLPPEYGNYAIYANVPFATQSYDELLAGAILFDRYIGDLMHYSYTFYDQNGTDITPALINSQATPGSVLGLSDDVTMYVYDYGFGSSMPNPLYIVATAPEAPSTYTVTWKNWDGTVLATDEVAAGATPEYTGEEPTKRADRVNMYTFNGWTPEVVAVAGDAEYTAVFNSEEITVQHGPQDDGTFYWLGEKQKAYKLIELEGDYYLVAEYNKYAKNQLRFLNASMVEGTDFAVGYYWFDADGKMTTLRNGPQADGCFYVNNERVNAYQLAEYEGNWYYICEYNKFAVNQRRYLNAATVDGTDFPAGYYDFDADGKMVIKNGPADDGYFYVNGVKQNAYKLVEFDGKWYFIAEYNKYAVNQRRYLNATVVEGTDFAAGYYYFGEDGAMTDEPAPAPAGKSFVKVTDTNQIASDNIGECTFAEAKAWILDNWDDVMNTYNDIEVVYFAGTDLKCFTIMSGMSKPLFETMPSGAEGNVSIDVVKDLFSYGDDVYICSKAS